MNSKKAIEILKKQIQKLDDSTFFKDENWVFQTASYIKDFFGENSTEYAFISKFEFKAYYTNYGNENDAIRELNSKTPKAKKYLENCIETISNKGLYKHPKTNFLNRISDSALWSIITFLLPIVFFSGYYFGNLYSNTQNVELKIENKTLKDSISILKNHSQPISNNNSNIVGIEKDTIKNESSLKGKEIKPENN